jgi:membrane-associated phospholipid phosphatase
MLGVAPAYIDARGRGSLPSTHAAVMFMVAVAFMLRPGLRRLGLSIAGAGCRHRLGSRVRGRSFPARHRGGLLLAALIAAARLGAWLVGAF